MVDVHVLLERIELAALVEQDLGQPVRREGRWLKWTCPFHADGKTPSLGVAGNRWKCFGCGRSGDAIDWLREGLSFQEACRRLGAMELLVTSATMTCPEPVTSSTPSASWQEQAQKVASICKAILWSDDGTRARAWLSRRGLSDETLQRWQLGFNPRDQKLAGL